MDTGQDVLNLLGLKFDLEQEMSLGNFFMPDKKQQEAAEINGYTFPVVIPGKIPRAELLKKIQAFLFNSFFGSLNYYTEDYRYTAVTLKPSRPKSCYQIYLKPQKEVNEAHPQTAGQTVDESIKSLEKANQLDSALNLKGLTLEEYLIAQVTMFHLKRDWFETTTTSWLLEEQIDTKDNPKSCLRAYFRVKAIGIGACPQKSHRPKRGARFAVLPNFKIIEDWQPKSQLLD